MIKGKFFIVFSIVLLLVVIVFIVFLLNSENKEIDNSSQMPNPASVNCEERGYDLVMRTNELGQYGVCIFPDGSECEEWAYYREECKIGDSLK